MYAVGQCVEHVTVSHSVKDCFSSREGIHAVPFAFKGGYPLYMVLTITSYLAHLPSYFDTSPTAASQVLRVSMIPNDSE